MARRFPRVGGLGAVALLLLLFALDRWQAPTPPAVPAPQAGAVEAAFRDGRSDLQVEVSGTVKRILADDDEGSRHQRFLVELASGHTVLVAHNIDLAPRVAGLRTGDPVRVYGEYEWNERGGVLHWTHRDPAGRHPHGWVEHGGRRYD